MRVITVQRLDGIPRDSAAALYDAMKGCTNGQRLAVALYLMSDLADRMHGLSRIEENLRRIFPKSLRHGKLPDDYKDFAAATVRALFNLETMAVKQGELAQAHRLWVWLNRGCWRNTSLGNQYALKVLRDRGIAIQRGGQLQQADAAALPAVKRPYLDEELAEPPISSSSNAATKDEVSDPESESLLAYADRILGDLPIRSSGPIPPQGSASVDLRGTPAEVRELITKLADHHAPADIELTLAIDHEGTMTVVLRTNRQLRPGGRK